MPDRSRRAQLRENTSQAHASLDRMVGSFESLDSYKNYLRGIWAFREAVERKLVSTVWPEQCDRWDAEMFSNLIADDLRDLDVTPQLSVDAPVLDQSPEALLGVLYVLEGSVLGARVLYKRAQKLGFDGDFGARHLAVQSRRSDRWPDFLALLESADSIDMERVANASRATFKTAEQAFRQASHEPA
ncbi:biliverdin-producing heme oxygenase [Rhizobium sp. PL01]|uniref:biliverdin-producing heme oxygenase n=1 Tax=Rhizobium sp. PL01 TaxID=3085631 RepID=UPI002980C9B1|nr:biliverdin-producing heme oxygenase [Rhizobium sp. PL01]MDW5316459.1 biliverdin-producing heme oxygenase [Rhizobium sp. PL01]